MACRWPVLKAVTYGEPTISLSAENLLHQLGQFPHSERLGQYMEKGMSNESGVFQDGPDVAASHRMAGGKDTRQFRVQAPDVVSQEKQPGEVVHNFRGAVFTETSSQRALTVTYDRVQFSGMLLQMGKGVIIANRRLDLESDVL